MHGTAELVSVLQSSDLEVERAQAAALWHSSNSIIIINNSGKGAAREVGRYERMGTMGYACSRLSCKLHEGDKATITVKRKMGDWHKDSFQWMCLESVDKAASLNRLQLWLTASLTAMIVTTKRNRSDWRTMQTADWRLSDVLCSVTSPESCGRFTPCFRCGTSVSIVSLSSGFKAENVQHANTLTVCRLSLCCERVKVCYPAQHKLKKRLLLLCSSRKAEDVFWAKRTSQPDLVQFGD